MSMTMADAAMDPQAMQMQQQAFGSPTGAPQNGNGMPPNANGAPQSMGMGGQDVNGGDMQSIFETVAMPLVDFVQGEGRPQVVQALGSTPDIGRNAGGLVSNMVLTQMQTAQQQANRRIPPEVVGQTSLQLSNLLADISIEEGLIEQGMGNELADDAFYHSLVQ